MGYTADQLRPKNTSRQLAGPAIWHREYGILCMKGPGCKKDDRIYEATVLDIVLTMLGLAVGSDMNGKPHTQSMYPPSRPKRVNSWESIEGDAGIHGPELRANPFETREAIKLLKPPIKDQPEESRYGRHLGLCYLAKRQHGDCRQLIERFLSRAEPQANDAVEQLEQQNRALHRYVQWQK